MKQLFYNLLVSLDQLANTIIGGNPDVTVSGHVGLKAAESSASNKWKLLEKILDFTFEPIESNHCLHCYLDENDEDYTDNFIASLIIISIGCVFLIPIVRGIRAFRSS